MPNSQIEHKAVYGLELQSNSFQVREGSLEVGENIVVSQDNIYKKRRGFKSFVNPSPVEVKSLTEYQDKIVGIAADRVEVYNQVDSGDDIGDYSSTTTLSNDTGVSFSVGDVVSKSRTVEQNGNLYFTSDDGVMKLESTTGNVLNSGVARALDLNIFRVFKPTSGSETYFPADSQVGWRILFKRKDANQNEILGAPSQLAIATNSSTLGTYTVAVSTVTLTVGASHGFSSGHYISIKDSTENIPDGSYLISGTGATTVSFDVTTTPAPTGGSLYWGSYKYGKLQFSLPPQIQSTAYIAQIYRSDASAAASITPDESTLQLVDEFNVTASDISVGFITYYDTTPDLLKADYLYTNPNTGEPRAEGDANDVPPQCKDMVLFKNHVFYLNCTSPYRLAASLISATATDMPDGAQFTIADQGSEKSFLPADVNTGTEEITCTSHGFATGDPIRFVTTGTLPTGITETGLWYAINVSTNVFKVASSYANAIALTAVNLTATGSGTFYVSKVRPFIGAAETDWGNQSLQPTSFGVAATTVTINRNSHGFATGDQIAVVEAVDSSENQLSDFPRGLYTITVTTANQFTFTVSPAPTTPNSITLQGTKDVSQNRYFYIDQSSTGLSTVASAIDTTAKAIVKAINQDPSKYCVAFYTSGATDIPGKMTLQSTGTMDNFTVSAVTSALANSFLPAFSQTDSEAEGTRRDEQGVVYVSKEGEGEAVPLLNNLVVGTRSNPILRGKALRDSLIICKQEGAFRINGSDINSFSVTILDSTVQLVASDSVAVLNNSVFGLCTQGVVAISETAAAIVARQIEPVLTAIFGKRSTTDNSDLVESQTHAYGYESERLYVLATLSPQAEETDVVYVYNQLTNAWTTSDKIFTDGFINPVEDKAYFVDLDGELFQERKKNNRLDYTDEEFDATILTVPSADSVTMSVVGGSPAIGDIFVLDGSEVINRIVDIDGSTLFFASDHALSASDTGKLYKAITSTIRTSPLHGGAVSRWKQFSEFQATFRNGAAMSAMTLAFITDSISGTEATDWTTDSESDGWGFDPWGNFPYGNEDGINAQFDTEPVQILRTYIPLDAQRATYIQAEMEHSVAAENIMLQSIAYTARGYGQRTTK